MLLHLNHLRPHMQLFWYVFMVVFIDEILKKSVVSSILFLLLDKHLARLFSVSFQGIPLCFLFFSVGK